MYGGESVPEREAWTEVRGRKRRVNLKCKSSVEITPDKIPLVTQNCFRKIPNTKSSVEITPDNPKPIKPNPNSSAIEFEAFLAEENQDGVHEMSRTEEGFGAREPPIMDSEAGNHVCARDDAPESELHKTTHLGFKNASGGSIKAEGEMDIKFVDNQLERGARAGSWWAR